ncbi:MAG: hypothetical protein E7393_02310 [Ruminococcaceae bacterium]|nr:hypothetical protein [Oscillospiraceae bacterium]
MAKRITFSAVSLALTVICLYGASSLPTGRIVSLALSSLFCGACVSQYGVRYGVVLYIGASLLSLLLIPKRLFVMLYILFAGYYPIVKLYIERLDKLWAEWIIKILFFNVVLVGFYALCRSFFLPNLNPSLLALVMQYMGLIVLGLELIFVLFDWSLSYMIGYYNQFIRRVLS